MAAEKSAIMLNGVQTTGASTKELFPSGKNLTFSIVSNEALVAGDDITVQLQYEVSDGSWITFKEYAIDETTEGGMTGDLDITHEVSNSRGWQEVRANVSVYTVASGTHTLTVYVNWRDPDPLTMERA